MYDVFKPIFHFLTDSSLPPAPPAPPNPPLPSIVSMMTEM